MPNIDELVYSLQDTTVARRVTLAFDEAREQYRLPCLTAPNWFVFQDTIADCFQFLYGRCVAQGARLPRTEALGMAKETIEREYRRRRSDITGAFADAREGTNGGMRGVVDAMAEGLKAQSVTRYAADVFDSRVAPNDFEAKVDIIRQFIARFGHQLGDSIQHDRPERYANDYRTLIEAFVDGLRQTSSIFRRL